MAMRILMLLQGRMRDPYFTAALSDPRVHDPMFVLYTLLGEVYSTSRSRYCNPGEKIK